MKCSRCGHEGSEDEFFPCSDANEFLCKVCVITEEAMYEAKKEVGKKNDQNKLRFDLVPTELTTLDAAVFTLGSEKYGDHNWKGGLAYHRILRAAQHHINARLMGERVDPESKLPHLAHARWNVGALLYYDLYESKYHQFDDVTSNCSLVLDLINDKFPWKAQP